MLSISFWEKNIFSKCIAIVIIIDYYFWAYWPLCSRSAPLPGSHSAVCWAAPVPGQWWHTFSESLDWWAAGMISDDKTQSFKLNLLYLTHPTATHVSRWLSFTLAPGYTGKMDLRFMQFNTYWLYKPTYRFFRFCV